MDPLAAEILTAADEAPALPRLGGMARPNGVIIVSERFWAFARSDGEILQGEMRRLSQPLRRVPLIRGLARIATALAPLFGGARIARRRERYLLAFLVAGPLALAFLPDEASLPAGFLLACCAVGWILRGRTLNLHGAEHRAIAAAERRLLDATWAGTAFPSRFATRCGTNFAALVVPVTLLLDWLWPFSAALYTPVVVPAFSLGLTMELWEVVQGSQSRPLRALLWPGLALQRVTTREPSLAETRVALAAVASVLRRELGSVDYPHA
jgi:uncharacterized protein YqhQ